jgi:hypothetical protein
MLYHRSSTLAELQGSSQVDRPDFGFLDNISMRWRNYTGGNQASWCSVGGRIGKGVLNLRLISMAASSILF